MKLSFRPARVWPVFAFPILLAGGLCLAQTPPPAVPVLSPAAGEVLKLAQAGIDASLMKTYVANVAGPFSLDAEGIIYLKDSGVPSEVINLMLTRDGAAAAPAMPAAAPAPMAAPMAAPAPAPEPPPVETPAPDPTPGADMSVDELSQTLTPYGAWVEVDGYGRCWRPTVAMYDASWQTYSERGQWVYTDAGWYWSSDYAWGVAFHYGRWFHHPQWGWCWWPDRVWAPSWVVWRSDDDNCGWAPLPPFAIYRPGAGFYYRGVLVGADYDFGLSVSFFTFVPAGRFCDRNPGHFRLDDRRREEVFHHAAIVGGYGEHGHGMANRGIPVERISAAAHRPITPVAVERAPGAGRPGGFQSGGQFAGHQPAVNQPAGHESVQGGQPQHYQGGQTEHYNGNTAGRPVASVPQAEPAVPNRPVQAAPSQHENLQGQSRYVPNNNGQSQSQREITPQRPEETHSYQAPAPVPQREAPRTYSPPAAPAAPAQSHEPSNPAPSQGHGQNLGNNKNNQGH